MNYGEGIIDYRHQAKLESFFDYCHHDEHIGMVVLVGDIFDSWAHPSNMPSQALEEVIRKEVWFWKKIVQVTSSDGGRHDPLKVVFVRGNHDDDLTARMIREVFASVPFGRDLLHRRDPENVIFGGDVFVVPSLDGLLVFTHGHLADAWNCRYWTGVKEPYGRFLTPLEASSVGKHSGPTGLLRYVRGLVERPRAGVVGFFANLLQGERWAVEFASGRNWNGIRNRPFYEERTLENPYQAREVRDAIESTNPLKLNARVAIPRFGSAAKLNALSGYRWLRNEESHSELRRSLSIPFVGVIPKLLLEMFLPGAVAIITGHIHGKPVTKKDAFECDSGRYEYVHANTGNWHPTSNSGNKLGGIHIHQSAETVRFSSIFFKGGEFEYIHGVTSHDPETTPRSCRGAFRMSSSQYWFHGTRGNFLDYRFVVTRPDADLALSYDVPLESVFDGRCSNCVLLHKEENWELHQCLGHDRRGNSVRVRVGVSKRVADEARRKRNDEQARQRQETARRQREALPRAHGQVMRVDEGFVVGRREIGERNG